jgi:hypothetical protein
VEERLDGLGDDLEKHLGFVGRPLFVLVGYIVVVGAHSLHNLQHWRGYL